MREERGERARAREREPKRTQLEERSLKALEVDVALHQRSV